MIPTLVRNWSPLPPLGAEPRWPKPPPLSPTATESKKSVPAKNKVLDTSHTESMSGLWNFFGRSRSPSPTRSRPQSPQSPSKRIGNFFGRSRSPSPVSPAQRRLDEVRARANAAQRQLDRNAAFQKATSTALEEQQARRDEAAKRLAKQNSIAAFAAARRKVAAVDSKVKDTEVAFNAAISRYAVHDETETKNITNLREKATKCAAKYTTDAETLEEHRTKLLEDDKARARAVLQRIDPKLYKEIRCKQQQEKYQKLCQNVVDSLTPNRAETPEAWRESMMAKKRAQRIDKMKTALKAGFLSKRMIDLQNQSQVQRQMAQQNMRNAVRTAGQRVNTEVKVAAAHGMNSVNALRTPVKKVQ